jgi:hypothetical protein
LGLRLPFRPTPNNTLRVAHEATHRARTLHLWPLTCGPALVSRSLLSAPVASFPRAAYMWVPPVFSPVCVLPFPGCLCDVDPYVSSAVGDRSRARGLRPPPRQQHPRVWRPHSGISSTGSYPPIKASQGAPRRTVPFLATPSRTSTYRRSKLPPPPTLGAFHSDSGSRLVVEERLVSEFVTSLVLYNGENGRHHGELARRRTRSSRTRTFPEPVKSAL